MNYLSEIIYNFIAKIIKMKIRSLVTVFCSVYKCIVDVIENYYFLKR